MTTLSLSQSAPWTTRDEQSRVSSKSPAPPSVRFTQVAAGQILSDERVRLPRRAALWATALLLLPNAALALLDAEPDNAAHYAAVVSIGTEGRWECTATKIGRKRFLTAAHCVVDLQTGAIKSALTGSNGSIDMRTTSRNGSGQIRLAAVLEQVLLAPAYEGALERFAAYKQQRIAELARKPEALTTIGGAAQIDRAMRIPHHFSARFPDLAILSLRDLTPSVPASEIDFAPLARNAPVVLVGYGCTRGADGRLRRTYTRSFGRTRIIRVDPVNFYTEGGQMTPGAPSLCPGDSGGPVLHKGKVVGVHGVVYGLNARHGARSNMAARLNTLATWDAWPKTAPKPEQEP